MQEPSYDESGKSGGEVQQREIYSMPMELDSTPIPVLAVSRVEKSAIRKVDFSVLLILCLGLFVFQLDRMNIASALTAGLRKEIGIDQSTINLGNQLLFLGIVLLEIPSNMLLAKIGPSIWISGQIVAFALVSMSQVFLKDRTGFLVSRSVLGLMEAGYIPGSIFTLSRWYTREQLARRVAIFFFGMFGANALGPLAASGIIEMDGVFGISGWKWIMLLEGLFTLIIGVLMIFMLPGSPDNPKPLVSNGVVRFSPEEKEFLRSRPDLAGSSKSGAGRQLTVTGRVVWKTVSHYRRWPHFLATFAVFGTWSPLTTYTPTIIMSLGFDRIKANTLASIGGFLALVVVFLFAVISDRTNARGLTVMMATLSYLVALIILHTLQPHVGKWGRFGLWTAANAFAVGYHPVHNTWVQLNCMDPGERSVSIAMWVMSANLGLMTGTQYFQGTDANIYSHGTSIMMGLVSAGLVLAGLQLVIYLIHNNRVKSGLGSGNGRTPRLYTP